MHELEVVVLDEPRTVTTPDELSEVIASRIAGGSHFEISSATTRYPMLDVLVQEPYAVVHWFPRDGDAGAQACSDVAEPPQEVAFPHGALGDRITMPGSVLIEVATAEACVEQFADTLSRPTLVDWIEM
jgi:Immunity protein Imm1